MYRVSHLIGAPLKILTAEYFLEYLSAGYFLEYFNIFLGGVFFRIFPRWREKMAWLTIFEILLLEEKNGVVYLADDLLLLSLF